MPLGREPKEEED